MDFGSNKKINYYYDGSGQKLSKVVLNGANPPVYTEYMGQFVHQYTQGGTSSLKYIITPEGRLKNKGTNDVPIWGWEYDLTDHLGNVRVIFKPNASGNGVVRVEYANYFPFGMKMLAPYSTYASAKYLYNGKEYQDDFGLNWYDYGARFYDATLGRWHSVDPLAAKYLSTSPYVYCANNPILLIDPDGMEWFYYSKDGKSDPTWNWRDEKVYHTGIKDNKGKEVVLQGTEAVVVFNGSRQERLGTKDGKSGYIDGEGARTANVTVYGPDGANDVHNYTGYTMTSDANKYGAIDEGIYDSNYDIAGKSGTLKSNWTLNNRGPVRMIDGEINPNAPWQVDGNGEGYKTGIFIHSSNSDGRASGSVSTGCLLIAPKNWSEFNSVMSGVQHFKVQVMRSQTERVPLQGVTGPVPNIFTLQKTTKF